MSAVPDQDVWGIVGLLVLTYFALLGRNGSQWVAQSADFRDLRVRHKNLNQLRLAAAKEIRGRLVDLVEAGEQIPKPRERAEVERDAEGAHCMILALLVSPRGLDMKSG